MAGLKILTISTKGGVGKSTVSMQLVAPYLFEKNGQMPIAYYECDDTNRDINSYGATAIIKRNLVSIGSPMLREELFDIVAQTNSACIDVGGNNTAKMVIDALDESGGLHFIDLVLIPTLDGEQDMLNALDTYKYIKEIRSDIKIIFVLNRVKESAFVYQQFDHFFGDSRGVFTNFLCAKEYLLKEEINSHIDLLESDVIRYSRRFGLTVYEIANLKKEYISEIVQNSDPKVASFKHYMSRGCKKYHHDVLNPSFAKIEEKLRS